MPEDPQVPMANRQTAPPVPIEEIGHPIKPIVDAWLGKLDMACKIKQEVFGKYADEAMKFYDGPHNWMWESDYARGVTGFMEKNATAHLPMFRMSVNRVFEAVALFGPALYQRNPDIEITPTPPPEIMPEELGINPEDPQQMMMYQQQMSAQQGYGGGMMEVVARLKERYANWLQVEARKQSHARRTIVEAIVKGMGLLYTEMFQPPGSQIKYPRSKYLSVDDLIIDSDPSYWEDVQWIAIRRIAPLNIVEERFGLQAGTLKGNLKSANAQGQLSGPKDRDRKRNRYKSDTTFDLIEYYEIYSKNGFGDRLHYGKKEKSKIDFESFGDNTYIVVAHGVPYPLNIPDVALVREDEQSLFMRAQWPIPYWMDNDWPVSPLYFYEKPGEVWPISLIKPAIGEMRFVNWCMSFLADKVAAASKSYVVAMKEAAQEIRKQLASGSAPYSVLELSSMSGRSVSDIVSFLEAPSFNKDIWTMVSEVMHLIDKRTGLTDLLYGLTNRQIRSATEAEVRDERTNIRPDDMAERVENWMSDVAKKEIIATCWMLERPDYEPVMGPMGASIFERYTSQMPPDTVVRDFSYRVASGSARKPNKAGKLRSLNELGQVLVPTLQEFAMQGLTDPWNAYISAVADALDLDATPFMVDIPQPEQEGPSPEEIQAQMEQQLKMMEAQIKQIEMAGKQQDMSMEREKHDMEMEQMDVDTSSRLRLTEANIDLLRKKAQILRTSSGSNGQ